MRVRTVTKFAVVGFSATLALSLSGCAAGNNAETRMTRQVTDGADASITAMGNDIKIRSALVVAQEDGSAVLTGSIFNNATTEDVLLGVSIGGKLATLSEKTFPISQSKPLSFAGLSKNAGAVIPGLNATIGTRIKLQFFFARAGEVMLTTMVREKSGDFANVGN